MLTPAADNTNVNVNVNGGKKSIRRSLLDEGAYLSEVHVYLIHGKPYLVSRNTHSVDSGSPSKNMRFVTPAFETLPVVHQGGSGKYPAVRWTKCAGGGETPSAVGSKWIAAESFSAGQQATLVEGAAQLAAHFKDRPTPAVLRVDFLVNFSAIIFSKFVLAPFSCKASFRPAVVDWWLGHLAAHVESALSPSCLRDWLRSHEPRRRCVESDTGFEKSTSA